jgi:hypothetical protein
VGRFVFILATRSAGIGKVPKIQAFTGTWRPRRAMDGVAGTTAEGCLEPSRYS